MSVRGSVFLDALGEEASRLHPAVFDYVAGPPSGLGAEGVGEGVFEVAGSRFGRLLAAVRPLVGPDLLVTRQEREVPFRIVNTPSVGADGRRRLTATRTFHFHDGPQRFRDVLIAPEAPGMLRNFLGPKRRLMLRVECAVSEQGHLLLRAHSAFVRVCGTVWRVPRALGVTARVEDGWDAARGRHTIDVAVRNPLVGTVLHYRGSFRYAYRDIGGEAAAATGTYRDAAEPDRS